MKKLIEGLRFIFWDIKTDGWRSTITIINLTVFISCYFCLFALAEAGHKFGTQKVNPNQLIMISQNVFDFTDSKISEKDFIPIQELLPDRVEKVTPLILKYMNVDGFLLQVRGARLEDFSTVHSLSLIDGKLPTSQAEVVIAEGAQSLTHWQVGEVIRIFGVDFTITGIVSSPGTKFGSIWMSLENAEQLFNTRGVYQFAWIQLSENVDPQMVIDQLNKDPRISDQFEVYYADQLYMQYTAAVKDIKEVSQLLVFFALLLIMFGVYGSTYLTLTERSRELTILRAVGFNSTSIRVILTIRTFILMAFAFFSGWVISGVVLLWFNEVKPIMVHAIPLPVIISVKILLLGILLSMFFSWIGVWLPTRHLKRTSVASMMQR